MTYLCVGNCSRTYRRGVRLKEIDHKRKLHARNGRRGSRVALLAAPPPPHPTPMLYIAKYSGLIYLYFFHLPVIQITTTSPSDCLFACELTFPQSLISQKSGNTLPWKSWPSWNGSGARKVDTWYQTGVYKRRYLSRYWWNTKEFPDNHTFDMHARQGGKWQLCLWLRVWFSFASYTWKKNMAHGYQFCPMRVSSMIIIRMLFFFYCYWSNKVV